LTAPFRAHIEELDGALSAVVVAGELDQATVPELQETLVPVMDDASQSLLVDLTECEFIDSSGLAALVAARERLTTSNGRSFAVCCPDTQVRRLLELTGLDRAMGLVESREQAITALRAAASPT
jgi:anti-sigma B factor antagonist